MSLPAKHLAPLVVENLRATIPAREVIERGGNRITTLPTSDGPRYRVELVRPPAGLVLVLVGHGERQSLALRLAEETPFPNEWPADAVAWWDRGQWVPCPTCGHALLWCEAGFVPGWRICLAGHAVQIATNGRSASRRPRHDAATLRATLPIG